MDTRLSVIINASSGAPKISGLSAELADRFKSAGFEANIRVVNSAEITAEVRRAVATRPEMIVISHRRCRVGTPDAVRLRWQQSV